jgi:hypothetical protein
MKKLVSVLGLIAAVGCGEDSAPMGVAPPVVVQPSTTTGNAQPTTTGDSGVVDSGIPVVDASAEAEASITECPSTCLTECFVDTLVCRCADECDTGCEDDGVTCFASLRGEWDVLREITFASSDCNSAVGTLASVDWNCVKSGNWDWPIQCSVSGETSYNPLSFKQELPDATGGITLPSGAYMNVTLTLDEDGDGFTGNETISTDCGSVQRELVGRRK